jgi:glucose/arabinose dehydrogenase
MGMRKTAGLLAGIALAAGSAPAQAAATCAQDNGGLTLPSDMCATVFADNLGQARHLVVAADGTVFVNTWRSPYKKDAKVPAGGFLVALHDSGGSGVADKVERFGEDSASGAVGGTGIAIHNGYLYAEASGRIVRYLLSQPRPLPAPRQLVPQGQPEVVLEGLPLDGDHTMHPFAIAPEGTLFVNSGACQIENRKLHSPGKDPCDELITRAGIWKYDSQRKGQRFDPSDRYASGLRNTVALDIHPVAGLYAVPHGRDQLHENWPELFTPEQGSDLPAEVMVQVIAGADYGWPYCYYDGMQKRYLLAPEYGGDGKKTDRCVGKPEPLATYPAHWAPDGLLFVIGTAVPQRYRGGAFIAFHGSWNRQQQQGYNVVFQPMDAAGKPNGQYQVFADGFAGPNKTPDGAAHRPTGVAIGPDGSIYVSDDQRGRVWRIVQR